MSNIKTFNNTHNPGYYNQDNTFNNTYNNLSSYPVDDYEELKQAYLNHLSQINPPFNQESSMDYNIIDCNRLPRDNYDYTSGMKNYREQPGAPFGRSASNGPSQFNYNINSYNTNDNNYDDRSNYINHIPVTTSPNEVNKQTSDKHFDKELKRKQQDEYRKFLDLQLKEQNLRKENQKLEK
jgi:hypothetical protein